MSDDPHTKALCRCGALSMATAIAPDTEINTTVASSTVPMETDVTSAITRPARSGSLVAYLATNRVAVSPRPTPAINPAMPRVDWMRPNSPKETCPKTRATRIMATRTKIRAVAEPKRLQSEPRARRRAMGEEASRSYRDEGRSFVSASTIDRLIPLAKGVPARSQDIENTSQKVRHSHRLAIWTHIESK